MCCESLGSFFFAFLSHELTLSLLLYRFRQDQIGQSWGYPYCWSEYCLSANVGGSGMKGANTVWAWPNFMNAGYTDEWCRENTNPSELSMPAHSAPLGITFYNYQEDESCEGGFPKSFDKYAFIAFHGSWNRSPPTGFKVVFVPFSEGNPTALPIDLFRHDGDSAKWPGGDLRPVDVQFDKCGRLFVTEDGTGSVIKITYNGGDSEQAVLTDTDVADGASCSQFQIPTTPPTNLPSAQPSDSTIYPPGEEVYQPGSEVSNGMPSAQPSPPPVETTTDIGTEETATDPPSKSWTLKPDCCFSSANMSSRLYGLEFVALFICIFLLH